MSLHRSVYLNAVTLVVFATFVAFSNPVRAQSDLNVQQEDTDVTIDAVGNALFVTKATYPAAAWANYKRNYGGNPSLLKRDLQHQYSSMSLHDIDLKNDEMNRVSTLTWKADAAAEYRGNGIWEVELVKKAQATKVNETLWQLTTTSPAGDGVIAQNTVHIHLPAGASAAEQAQSETGDPVLRYSMGDHSRSPLPWLAALAGLLGVVLLVAGFAGKPATAPR